MDSERDQGRSRPPRRTDLPLPAYAYVPGESPHPRRSPEGHSFTADEPERLPLGDWRANETFLHGVDLYNHGYYWEAHEAWEALWHGEGRAGDAADLLKGLIQTTAAHVKSLQRCEAGVRILAEKSLRLLDGVRERSSVLAGIDLEDFVVRHRRHFATRAIPDPEDPGFPSIELEINS